MRESVEVYSKGEPYKITVKKYRASAALIAI